MNAALERAHAAQQPRRFSLCTAEDIVRAIRELPSTHANLVAIVGAAEVMANASIVYGINGLDEVRELLSRAWALLEDCYVREA